MFAHANVIDSPAEYVIAGILALFCIAAAAFVVACFFLD